MYNYKYVPCTRDRCFRNKNAVRVDKLREVKLTLFRKLFEKQTILELILAITSSNYFYCSGDLCWEIRII